MRKMKKILLCGSLVLVAGLCVGGFASCGSGGESETPENELVWDFEDCGDYVALHGVYYMYGTPEVEEELEIPSEWNGLPVKQIGSGTGSIISSASFTKVVIPNTVETVAANAFMHVDEEIVFGGSEKTIGEGAFKQYQGDSIVIPDSVETLGDAVFNGGEMKNIVLGDGVSSIGEDAFEGCTQLLSITIGESVREALSLRDSNKLVEIYNKSSHFTLTVGEYGTMAANVREVCTENYQTKISKKGDFYMYSDKDAGLELLVAYYGMEKDVVLPAETTEINRYAFRDLLYGQHITNVTIGDNVKRIGEQAFGYMRTLTHVTVGKSVEGIGKDAFVGNMKLVEIYNRSDMEIIRGVDSDLNGHIAQYARNVYGEGEQSRIQVIDDWQYYVEGDAKVLLDYVGADDIGDFVVGSDVVEIAPYALFNRELASLFVPKTVTSFGRNAVMNSTQYVYFESNETTRDDSLDYKYYFYSEEQPTGEGQFWHYVNGVPTVWE
ncbi:MAG: leucine-rich repeat protein [Clostridia bacterium]|nr:leucine-rich repeat protein [Clostridia bacterium]